MSEINDAFLKGLQQDCLVSIDDQHQELVQILNSDFSDHPGKVVGTFLKECHSMKGNLQAVGFKFFSEYIHEFESALQGVQGQLGSSGKIEDAQAKSILEFFLSDVLSHILAYKSSLYSSFKDEEKIKNSKMMSIAVLKDWKSGSAVSAESQNAAATPEVEQKSQKVEDNFFDLGPDPLAETAIAVAADSGPKLEVVSEKSVEVAAEAAKIKSPGSDAHSHKVTVPQRYLMFKIDDRNLAMNVQNVVEVSQWLKLTALPKKKDCILGLINWMGEILPVVDFSESKKNRSVDEPFPFILITRMNGNVVAIGVDGVDQVSQIDVSGFQTLPDSLGQTGRSVMTHIGRFESKTLVLVDFDNVRVA